MGQKYMTVENPTEQVEEARAPQDAPDSALPGEHEADRAHLREFARAITRNLGEGVYALDERGRVTFLNPAAERMLGWTQAELLGKDMHSAIHHQHGDGTPFPESECPLVQVIRSGHTVRVEDDVFTRKDGGMFPVTYVSAPLLVDGRIRGATLAFHDITERMRLEEERMQMLNVVSHELKTPLTSIKALAQVSYRRARRGKPVDERHLERLEQDVARMERLVNDLLDAGRLETGNLTLDRERLDLTALCEQAAEEQMAASGRVVTLRLPNVPVEVEADAVRITQVLTNLLANALKYSPTEAPVSLTLSREHGVARVEVRDAGPGIAPEALPHLFERFYRAPDVQVLHGSGVGLGVGLYISRKLIERHGGRIGVESVARKGTTFWFTLPLAAA